MSTRRKQTMGASALVVLAVLFLALTMTANVALRGMQVDLTDNGLYTISQGTKNILSKIDEPIHLYFYFSSQAAADQPSLRAYAQRVQELLEEFVLRSNGKLSLQVIDPVAFSEEEDDAARFGLQGVPVGQTGDTIYMGLAGTNATDKQEVIPFFDPQKESFLEYDVARLVYSLAHPKHPVIGLLSTLPISAGFDFNTQQTRDEWAIMSEIEQLFEVRQIEPSVKHIDDDVDVLMIVHPKNYSDTMLYAIDQFVLRGGKAMVFVDPHAEADVPAQDPSNPTAAMMASRSSNLPKLLDAWGVRYDPEKVVLDAGRALSVGGRRGAPVRHLAFLGLGAEDFDREDVVTSGLTSVNLAFAGYLEHKEDAKTTFLPLMSSSEQAMVVGAEKFRFLPDPAQLMDGYTPGGKSLAFAARITGKVKSAFPGGYQAPKDEAKDPNADPAGDPPADDKPLPPHIEESADDVNVIVVADTDLLADRMWVQVQQFFGQRLLQAFANNADFVVNGLDNLTGSSDLIGIRSRATYSRPFERVEALRRKADADFRSTEQSLQDQLSETERKLSELQSQRKEGENLTILSPEQSAEIDRFQKQKLEIRKQLRQVRRNLEKDIDALGTTLQVINVLLVPVLVAIVALGVFWMRSRRKAA
jgi:gliding motility-associatede transport system auxiliary component